MKVQKPRSQEHKRRFLRMPPRPLTAPATGKADAVLFSGTVAGAVLGAMAGPPGIVAGSILGAAAGMAAGAALLEEDEEKRAETERLDEAIGVVSEGSTPSEGPLQSLEKDAS